MAVFRNTFVPRGCIPLGLATVADLAVNVVAAGPQGFDDPPGAAFVYSFEDDLLDELRTAPKQIIIRQDMTGVEGAESQYIWLKTPMSVVRDAQIKSFAHWLADESLFAFRRSLSEGEITADLISAANGKRIPIPKHYWNSSACEEVLWHDTPASIEMEGNKVFGQVILAIDDLTELWAVRAAATDVETVGGGLNRLCQPPQRATEERAMIQPWSEPFIPRGYVSLGIATVVALVAPLALHPELDPPSEQFRIPAEDTVPLLLLRHGVRLTENGEELYLLPPMTSVLEMGSRRRGGLLVSSLAEHAINDFRRSLSSGHIAAYVFDAESGSRVNVPPQYWNSAAAGEVLWKDSPATFEVDGDQMCGWILFEHSELARFLTGSGNGLSAEARAIPLPAPCGASAACLPTADPSGAAEADELPYLAFMRWVKRELGLAPGRRVETKETIQRFIRSNWPAHLGPWSDRKGKLMATFLGDPSSESGGKFSQESVAARAYPKR